MSGLGSFSNVRFRIFCFWLLSYLWAGWAGSGRLAPKLSTPSTGSPRSGLTRQTLSWRLTFRSGSRPRERGRSRAVRGTGRWRRSSIRARGWCSWRSDAVGNEASAEASLQSEHLPAHHEPAHVDIRQQRLSRASVVRVMPSAAPTRVRRAWMDKISREDLLDRISRSKTGQTTRYLIRTYHLLPTQDSGLVAASENALKHLPRLVVPPDGQMSEQTPLP